MTSSSNAWIDSYIDALVRQHEHRRVWRQADDASQMRAGEPVGEPIHGAPAVDADRRLYVRPCVMDISAPLLHALTHALPGLLLAGRILRTPLDSRA